VRGRPVELLDRRQAAAMIGGDYYLGAPIERRGGRINPLACVRGLARAAIKAGAAQINPSCSQPSAAIASPWRLACFSGASSAATKGARSPAAHRRSRAAHPCEDAIAADRALRRAATLRRRH
jgi:hypothetical protein